MNSHTITKLVRKNSSYYYCEEHNTSYPTKQSLESDHPNLDETLIVIFDKRQVQEFLEFKLQEAYHNDKSHTQILTENV